MNKVDVPKKKGVLISEDIYQKLLKIQLDLSYKNNKRYSLERTIEHVLSNWK